MINTEGIVEGGTFGEKVSVKNRDAKEEAERTALVDPDKIKPSIISGGTINGPVENNSQITGGYFYGTVENNGSRATISGGNFKKEITGNNPGGVDKSKIAKIRPASAPASAPAGEDKPASYSQVSEADASELQANYNILSNIIASSSNGQVISIPKEWNMNCLPLSIVKQMSQKKNCVLKFEFVYSGIHYAYAIPAERFVVVDSIPYYGPLYLLANYGDCLVLE